MKKKYFTDEEKKEARRLEAKKYYDKKRKKPLSDEEKEKIKSKRLEKRKSYEKEYYQKNKAKILKQSKQYFKDNQKIKQEKNNERYKERRQTDPIFKLATNLKRNIRGVLSRKAFSKKSKTQEILGCSFEELKQYLETKFESWMNWDNYGKYNGEVNFGWDIDHIIPLASAKTEDELLKLNHFSNLQPLCSRINRDVKRDNILTVNKIDDISNFVIK
jgi:membrane-associated HD superfamily phosphohydrolase